MRLQTPCAGRRQNFLTPWDSRAGFLPLSGLLFLPCACLLLSGLPWKLATKRQSVSGSSKFLDVIVQCWIRKGTHDRGT